MPAEASVGQDVKLVINNATVSMPEGEQPPIIKANRTYVPLRIVGENLGAYVKWDGSTKRVIINTGNQNGGVPANNTNKLSIVIDGELLDIPATYGSPYISKAGRTMIPLRAVGEALGCQVKWLRDTKTVDITSIEEDPVSFIPIDNKKDNLINQLIDYKANIRLYDGRFINTSVLNGKATYSKEEMAHFKSIKELLDQYNDVIELPDGDVAMSEFTIMGESIATADQLNDWLDEETWRIKNKVENELNKEFKPIPKDLAKLYIEIGKQYGIRGDIAFSQAVKETFYFQFTGDVQSWQNNFSGIWAIGSPLTGLEDLNGADGGSVFFEPGVHGVVFATPEIGVEAHIQHLYAYATEEPLPKNKTLYDPRFSLVTKGSAPTWISLNARWAVPGTTYGQSIVQDYWLKAL